QLTVGSIGEGHLNIENGGTATSTLAFLGSSLGSMGYVTVTGPGSTWSATNSIGVGLNKTGALGVQAGGPGSVPDINFGTSTGSTGIGTVRGAGSSWSCPGVFVGGSGKGTLSIENGGTATSQSVFIGFNAGADGSSVTITGTNSKWTVDFEADVGGDATGA